MLHAADAGPVLRASPILRRGPWRRAGSLGVLFAAQLLAAVQGDAVALSQSILWFASGVGIAGVWLLGPWAFLVVVAATAVHRIHIGYDVSVFVPESLGSGGEALVGAWLMRRFGLRPELARLRDVLVLFAAASVAPLVSMFMSYVGRSVPGTEFASLGFLSGWFGWWRMNALGVLTVVPIVLTWSARLREPLAPRAMLEGVAALALSLGLLSLVVLATTPSATAITLLHSVLAIALVAALRQGPVAANTVAAISAMFVAMATARGLGPFQFVDYGERHVAAQVFLLALVSVPLVLGALVAERQENAKQWLRSEGMRRALLAVLPDSTLRLDGAGAVIDAYVVGHQEALLPGPIEVGQSLAAAVPAENRDRVAVAIARASAGERPEPIEFVLQRDAVEQVVEVRMVPAPGGELLAVVRDVSARRHLEAQLRQLQKLEAIGKLAGGVAHDFNNLLTIVAGNAESIRDQAPAGSEARECAVEIVDAAGRGANLTRQLLAFSRQQVLHFEEIDLAAAVEQIVALLRRLLGADIEVTTSPAAAVWVRADRGQIEQVLMNLAVNARDAMPGGGALAISTRLCRIDGATALTRAVAAGEFVELEVRDTGIGMSPEVQARAFEPFFTTKEQGRGTGLGLATVYGIVRQCGGAAAIDSAVGVGTTVRIWLPAVAPLGAPDAPAAAASQGATVGRLLVVEDEPSVQELLRRTLVQAGYSVVVAEDGEGGLVAAQRHGPFDLLLTDLVMPRMGGLELARRLIGTQPGLPVLFVSAHARDAEGVALTAVPRSAFLAKPFQRAELLAAVARLLARNAAAPRGSVGPQAGAG